MANYIVYRESDGAIQRTGICPQDAIAAQAIYPGERAMEGTADDRTQQVVEGKVVPK